MKAYERLIDYTRFPSASCENNECCPSTPVQRDLAEYLADEMKKIGVSNVTVDENGYVFGEIPANDDKPHQTVGFIGHVDVVDDVPYENVKPTVIKNYDGKEIVLNKEKNIVMSPDEFDTLKKYVGCDLVVTDGTTLLGADDKAGVAEIMTAAETLINDKSIKHGKVMIGFTPDEEIGRGALKFDVKRFGADFAFTLDGASAGEVVYETFNAAAAQITVNGKNIHPGSAKNKMKNAVLIAMEFEKMLPENEKPQYTEDHEGFYHLNEMGGTVETACMNYILRDHDAKKLETRKQTVLNIVDYLNKKYGDGTVVAEIKDQYRNMAEVIKNKPEIMNIALDAVRKSGIEPLIVPIRGGTDGSTLSFMGLPCPNLGTGSHNHHGKFEYACVQAMDKCVEIVLNIIKSV